MATETEKLRNEFDIFQIVEDEKFKLLKSMINSLQNRVDVVETRSDSDADARQLRLTCISLVSGLSASGATAMELIDRASAMAEYILNGTKPTEGEG